MLMKSKNRFEKLFREKRKTLMPYACFGYPTMSESKKIMQVLLENGGDALEIGFPFSDPVADGPVLTKANSQALKQKITLKDVFKAVRELRENGFQQPITLMSYYNIILQSGKKKLVEEIIRSEIDALLIPDIPLQEKMEIAQISPIKKAFLIGLNTSTETIKKLSELRPEYFYLTAKFGVTGTEKEPDPQINKKIKEIRKNSEIPIAAGFGISTRKQAEKINANGIIAGSVFVKAYNAGGIKKMAGKAKKLAFK